MINPVDNAPVSVKPQTPYVNPTNSDKENFFCRIPPCYEFSLSESPLKIYISTIFNFRTMLGRIIGVIRVPCMS